MSVIHRVKDKPCREIGACRRRIGLETRRRPLRRSWRAPNKGQAEDNGYRVYVAIGVKAPVVASTENAVEGI